ncbi:MAG: acetyl/propionyl/methylcrotonyl-CoA carboxylase subunit alpha [Litorimonas sp.]
MTPITKILIANRGEIACRVIRTAQRMNIATVAVYSDADRDALHVRMADEAVHIGPAPAAESYLVIDTIIAAAKETGADAVHPGYGFLSENPAFVRACEAAGIVFIGPSAEAMEAMGLKDAAKALMAKAGVPVTPGYQGENQDPDVLAEQAAEIGYPVLIKAVAGGGGKGMRKVEDPDAFKPALASCQREAASSFGNDHVLIEKYITSPRHIEVQVFGDQSGRVVHLFERDCSLQRRHQKVIEEAPAPGMTPDVRAAMTDAAIRAAEAVDYVGAGTVEFIVDGSGPLRTDGFWFMEMNTRLQVEHPVTEEITGLDLVEWQIRVARGEDLPAQGEITMEGHAIEARLYAEDPEKGFLPSVGQLEILTLPSINRVDTGVEQGGNVSQFYDPMIAKLIAFGETRSDAIRSLDGMCRLTMVYPIRTNARFLHNCLTHPSFASGHLSTHFIAENSDALMPTDLIERDNNAIARAILPQGDETIFGQVSGWRLNQAAKVDFVRMIDGEMVELPLKPKSSGEDVRTTILMKRPDGQLVFVEGRYYAVTDGHADAGTLLNGRSVSAPMPGKVISMLVKPGDAVDADQPLVILEAMKMEMTLKSPRAGTVESVGAEDGALVEDGQPLVVLAEDG